MRRQRPLLLSGNSKLGNSISTWSIPAVDSCPGSTKLCRTVCYATQHRFRFEQTRRRLAWNWEQSRRPDFINRMVREIRVQGVLVMRVHVAGDFPDVEYTERWLAIMKRAPRPRYFLFTRSWRLPEIATVLEKMARLRCAKIWYSFDDETGVPCRVPEGVRLAYLQTTEVPPPRSSQLVFRTRKLRSLPSLPVVCSSETAEGKRSGVTCGSCARCFQ